MYAYFTIFSTLFEKMAEFLTQRLENYQNTKTEAAEVNNSVVIF